MTNEEIYFKAIVEWGAKFQMDMAVEECSELIKALMKYRRPDLQEDREELVDNVIEEIADVEIICEVLGLLFDREKIDKVKRFKIDRLKKRIDKSIARKKEME